ncbi:MAG: hypothetical protein PHT07_15270 [Paludibacter sp.]|nr:hypothetical protein [Paludibacter sp.]
MKAKILKLWEAFKNLKFFIFFATIGGRIVARSKSVKTKQIKLSWSEYSKFLIKKYEKWSQQPLIIVVENTGNETLKDVEVLYAVKRFIVNFSLGWDQSPDLKFTYGIPGINYEEFLTHLLSYKYRIGQVRLSADSKTEDFKLESLTMWFVEKEANGNIFGWPVVPLIDSNQYQKSIFDSHNEFKLDCFTSLKFSIIPPLTKLRIFLYPSLRY